MLTAGLVDEGSGLSQTAPRALSHSAFDDDASTMGSALRGILGVHDDSMQLQTSPFVQGGRSIALNQPAYQLS